jgi:hypothetical protein
MPSCTTAELPSASTDCGILDGTITRYRITAVTVGSPSTHSAAAKLSYNHIGCSHWTGSAVLSEYERVPAAVQRSVRCMGAPRQSNRYVPVIAHGSVAVRRRTLQAASEEGGAAGGRRGGRSSNSRCKEGGCVHVCARASVSVCWCVSELVRDGALACVRACARVNVCGRRHSPPADGPQRVIAHLQTNKHTFADSEYHSLRIATALAAHIGLVGIATWTSAKPSCETICGSSSAAANAFCLAKYLSRIPAIGIAHLS